MPLIDGDTLTTHESLIAGVREQNGAHALIGKGGHTFTIPRGESTCLKKEDVPPLA